MIFFPFPALPPQADTMPVESQQGSGKVIILGLLSPTPLIMKPLTILAIALAFAVQASAQKSISCQYIAIKKAQYDSVVRTPFLVFNNQVRKQSGRLLIPLPNQQYKIFNDINVDADMGEYSYLGDVRGTKLALVKKTELHNERYYLVNQVTGKVDTLIGVPVFAANMQDFACLNNPDTDEDQQIQVGFLKDNLVITKGYITTKAKTFFYGIAYGGRNALFAKDDHGKYWKLDPLTE